MAINVKCPKCGEVLEAPDGYEGQAECPSCSAAISIPARVVLKAVKVASSISSIPPVPPVPSPSSIAPASPVAPVTPQVSGMAIASMVLGIIGVCGGWFCSGPLFPILAIIFGHIAFSKISKNPTRYTGKWMAIAGFTLGYAGIVIWAIVYFAMKDSIAEMDKLTNEMNKVMGVRK
jgi:hypothetical protein